MFLGHCSRYHIFASTRFLVNFHHAFMSQERNVHGDCQLWFPNCTLLSDGVRVLATIRRVTQLK